MWHQVLAKSILTLLLIVVLVFIAGCAGSTPPTGVPLEPTHTAIPTPTLAPTPFPTAAATQTPFPTLNIEATVAAGIKATTAAMPTATFSATSTPAPSPTATPTPKPTATVTPIPTATPTSVPTLTPRPTATRGPTRTPRPRFTPTPYPTATPAPTPIPLLALLYQEDFEDVDNKGFTIRDRDTYTRGYLEGEYRVLVKRTNWYVSAPLSRIYTDFDVKVDARIDTQYNSKAYGLVFRREDSQNFYAFAVDPTTGEYRVRRKLDDSWTTIVPWTGSDFIKRGTVTNEVRVVARGDVAKLFINGERVESVGAIDFKSGNIGLYSYNRTGNYGVEIFFDNLRVYGPESELLPTPTPAPTLVPITLPPGTSELLYQDDFGDPNSGWGTVTHDHYERGYWQGEYRFFVKNLNWYVPALSPTSFTDFDLRVQARYEGGLGGKAYAVAFRRVDSDNWYAWWVDPISGSYRLNKSVRGEWTTLIGWGRSPWLQPNANSMDLRVVARGAKFQLYINDTPIDSYSDASHASGRVGLFALNDVDQDGAEMFFDNLRVFGLR